ncbi:hypothetical protein QUF72_14995 [Desulfobacterales bacterium HSG2]|nr:hypothetical protein [Desulfobacterales bacterium HSG2]
MSKLVNEESWVWVVIQDPEKNEQLLGQHDEKSDVSYIPTFLEKDEALKCYNYLALDKSRKYDIQAMLYEELASQASENGFMLFILNGSGEVLEKAGP